jgi:hypothetical protein
MNGGCGSQIGLIQWRRPGIVMAEAEKSQEQSARRVEF